MLPQLLPVPRKSIQSRATKSDKFVIIVDQKWPMRVDKPQVHKGLSTSAILDPESVAKGEKIESRSGI